MNAIFVFPNFTGLGLVGQLLFELGVGDGPKHKVIRFKINLDRALLGDVALYQRLGKLVFDVLLQRTL